MSVLANERVSIARQKKSQEEKTHKKIKTKTSKKINEIFYFTLPSNIKVNYFTHLLSEFLANK